MSKKSSQKALGTMNNLHHRIEKVQVCDARDDDSSNTAHFTIINFA